MPIYKCPRCRNEFKQIGHYNKHIAKKTPCEVVESSENLTNQTIKPILKYVGGKTQILNAVLARFPPTSKIRNYYEPFVGGGSVLLGFLENNPQFKGQIVASDANPRLINFYKIIQTDVDSFLKEIKKLCTAYSKIKALHGGEREPENTKEAQQSQEAFYYWQRIRYNALSEKEAEGAAAAALFLFLNRTCFRGLHRVGPHGFNVPFGNYVDPVIYEEEHVRKVSSLIAPVKFVCSDFREIITMAGEGDFVYVDPPYVQIILTERDKKNSFVGYNADGFSPIDHEELFDECEALGTRGASWLMSNSDVDVLRGRFEREPYTVETIVCRRTINPKHPEDKQNELFIRFVAAVHTAP